MKKLVFLILILISSQPMSSQSLSEFQWNNRLIVVFTKSAEDDILQEQTALFEKDLQEFKERKLVFIQAIPGKQKIVLPETSGWKTSDLYTDMKQSKNDFEVILIGLDGGVKLRQTEILETEKLFNLIDSMPMRQAEMREKND